jgi:hypothetical protein
MQKTRTILTALLFVLCLGVSGVAEEITLTTYYPAPYGAYKEFTTTEKTCLATSSGNVGIGTTSPSGKLYMYLGNISNTNNTAVGTTIYANATGNPGYMGERFVLDNSTANYAGFIRGVRTTGTSFIGLEIGSETNHGIRFLTNGTNDGAEKVRISSSGAVGIGTTNPSYKLDVAGDINTTGDIRKSGTVYMNPDYVFEAGYKLMPLTELKGYLETNKHLPNLPSTEEIKKEGVRIFEQNRLILEKLEEAYLYIIELEQRIKKLEGR